MKEKAKRVLIESLPVILFSALIMALVIYAWTEPSQTPPQGNVPAPINVGTTTQYKSGALGVGGVISGYSDAYFNGNVGIGTTTPSYKLDVAGDINGQRLCIKGDCKDNWAIGGSVGFEVVEFTSAGTYNWQVPQGVTKILVWAVAGGGGGGGGWFLTGSGGGGGAGEFVLGEVLNVSPGETLTIKVGKGGSGCPEVNGYWEAITKSGGNGENTVIQGSKSGILLNLVGGGGGKTAWADVTMQCFESGCIYNAINVYDGSGLYAQKGKEGVGVGGKGGRGKGITGDLPATSTPSDGSSFIKIGGKAGEINGGGGGAASPFGNGGNGGSGPWPSCSPPTPGFRGSGGGGGTYGGGCDRNGAPGGDGYVKIIYFK
jgi:hypothetical protein